MRMAVVDARAVLLYNLQKIPPLRVQGIGGDFETGSDMAQPGE